MKHYVLAVLFVVFSLSGSALAAFVLDENAADPAGEWMSAVGSNGFYGSFMTAYAADTPTATCSWQFNVAESGWYEVSAWAGAWHSGLSRFTPYEINQGSTTTTFLVDQHVGSDSWFAFSGPIHLQGGSVTISVSNATGEEDVMVVADAIKVEAVPEPTSLIAVLSGVAAVAARRRRR